MRADQERIVDWRSGYAGVMDVQRLAEIIADDLARGERLGPMLRVLRQFIMDADRRARETGDPTPLLETRPESTGEERWDVLIAGVV